MHARLIEAGDDKAHIAATVGDFRGSAQGDRQTHDRLRRGFDLCGAANDAQAIDNMVVLVHQAHPVVLDLLRFVDQLERIGILDGAVGSDARSEEHTSELQSLMRISYAVFCLKKKTQITTSAY